jgi:perosamine synthetase
MTIPHNRPWITVEDKQAVHDVLASGWIAPGAQVAALEAAFVKHMSGGSSCAVSSGTTALYLALRGLGIGPGKIVAAPSYACSAILNAIHMAGASPALVDVRSDDFTIDVDRLSDQAPDACCAIAIHTFGSSANVKAMKSRGLMVVEDCCQSLGGPQGREGDAAIFSFYASKIITGGHGGLVWDRTGAVAEAARDHVYFDGRDDWKPRFNFQLTDIQAALILSQFHRLDEIRRRRRALRNIYLAALPTGFGTQAGLDDPTILPYRMVVRTSHAERESLQAELKQSHVGTIVPIARWELLHRYLGKDHNLYPISELLADTTLSLPLYPDLLEHDIERVCSVLQRRHI